MQNNGISGSFLGVLGNSFTCSWGLGRDCRELPRYRNPFPKATQGPHGQVTQGAATRTLGRGGGATLLYCIHLYYTMLYHFCSILYCTLLYCIISTSWLNTGTICEARPRAQDEQLRQAAHPQIRSSPCFWLRSCSLGSGFSFEVVGLRF